MSKEIAQTVGGKRFAWLLALLAVFALLAGSQLATGKASAAGSDGTLSAPQDVPGGLHLANDGDNDAGDLDWLMPGLYHVSPTGALMAAFTDDVDADGAGAGTVIADLFIAAPRDIENNLIGWEHIICLVAPRDNGGEIVDILTANGLADGDTNDEIDDDLQPDGGDGGIIGDDLAAASPDDYNWRINSLLGAADVAAAQKIDLDFDLYENGDDLPCIRWYSSGPGEQDITVLDEQGTVAADMADGGDQEFANTGDVCPDDSPENDECDNQTSTTAAGTFNGLTGPAVPLVKEWNTLLRTTITRPGSSVNLDENVVFPTPAPQIVGAEFNPGTSVYVSAPTRFNENVIGSHVTQGGAVLETIVVGARVTFTATGSCGFTSVDPEGTTTLEATRRDIGVGESVTVTSIGVPIAFDVWSYATDGGCTVLGDMNHTVTVTVAYPTNIGSVNPPAPGPEKISVRWIAQIEHKSVLLAWAGQRIVLEHDWRLGDQGLEWIHGGDNDALVCPFTGSGLSGIVAGTILDMFVVKYVKQSGPGTFLDLGDVHNIGALPDLILNLISPDEANVFVHVANCVSRAVFESNPPGQVDITATVIDHRGCVPFTIGCNSGDRLNQTKIDFVIYYMKFEDVKLSLVTSVSKPTHNSSASGWRDYSPGNPWDASKDVLETEWNVSRDLLVRGRVRGWVVTENPSGRARDASDELNVRPADRWILPDDWAILAGGPKDLADDKDVKGNAEEFRPYFDLMIAPNNVSGLALVRPEGAGTVSQQVATVVAWPGTNPFASATASRFAISSSANISVGSEIFVAPGATDAFGNCIVAGPDSTVTVQTVFPILNSSGNVVGVGITVSPALCAAPTAGAAVLLQTDPFEGPLSLIDKPGFNTGAAPSDFVPGSTRDTTFADGDVDRWDAPIPQAPVSVRIRGAGFIKQVLKEDVYYLGTANTAGQTFPNPYYIVDIPAEPWISAISAGGGHLWDTWALDGPGGVGQGVYRFWRFARVDANISGPVSDLTNLEKAELNVIRAIYGDDSITRDALVFIDNHGEFMLTANGDFKLDYSGCAVNNLAQAGARHCKPGDLVGSSTITAVVDYPEFRGKHPPVGSNAVTVDWIWGGYKDVTIEAGETPQFAYLVFHAMDRDGFCSFPYASRGTVSLHPVLSRLDSTVITHNVAANQTLGQVADRYGITLQALIAANPSLRDNYASLITTTVLNPALTPTLSIPVRVGVNDPVESIDFLIDAGEGIIVGQSGGGTLNVDGTRQFVTGVPTFSTAENSTIREFPLSPLAPAESTDECQAWVRISNSLLGVANFLVIAHDDEGDIGFDRIVDLQGTATITLNFRWSLVTWTGADNIAVATALGDIADDVTAVYGWNQAAQDWLGYFPSGVSVPGANDLTHLRTGQAYWIAIKAPGPVTWTYATHVD